MREKAARLGMTNLFVLDGLLDGDHVAPLACVLAWALACGQDRPESLEEWRTQRSRLDEQSARHAGG